MKPFYPFLLITLFASFGWTQDTTSEPKTDTVTDRVAAPSRWIIDTHTHFKSAEQIEIESQTTTWHPSNTLGHVVLPEDYRNVAGQNQIESTVVVEAVDQAHPRFNDWLLDQAKSDLICGYVARGDLKSDHFRANYQRYQESGFLKGYRFRNDELRGYLSDATALGNLKMLEMDGKVIDLLVDQSHTADVVQLATRFPELKIVLNHCLRVRTEKGKATERWRSAVTTCAKQPNVYCKISSILDFAGTKAFGEPAPLDSEVIQQVMETCFNAFGEDRIVFGTNWGVCTHFGEVKDVVQLVSVFLKSKGENALKKGMRENAMTMYRISANR